MQQQQQKCNKNQQPKKRTACHNTPADTLTRAFSLSTTSFSAKITHRDLETAKEVSNYLIGPWEKVGTMAKGSVLCHFLFVINPGFH